MMKILIMILSLNILTLIMKNWNLLIMNLLILSNLLFMKNLFYLNYYWSNINYLMGIDYISFSLIFLTLWIMILSIYSFNKKNILFMNIMIFMLITLIMTFCSMNMIIFYIFFETSLIPITLIIMGWGYQIDRIQASMYMLFYTLFGSLPLLIMIMYIYLKMNNLMMNILWMKNMQSNNFLFFIMMNLAFFIKMPIYLTHLWLPKAHVEAPIMGSMILAGVMLKLGSYGMYRSLLIFPKMMMNFNTCMIIISLMGSLITSLICMNQSDLKIIVAYSSIVHMSMLLASMFTLMKMSFKGSLMMMIAHGLCSSGLFFLVNLNYEQLKSRNLFINKNMLNISPSMTLWWFLLCTANFSAPTSLNLFSEILMLNSLIQWNKLLIMMIIMTSFFSTCYSIFLYSSPQYNKLSLLFNYKNINMKNFLIITMHWLPLNFMFFNMNMLM
uniref:NADH-ubiquinone oxidoreductase chain 4 n=1 Tax=Diachasmimorpha longicaudata TaxID=58733 RepID=D8WHC1_9HYME|nr:NADH dehydrogenase subunit 4 [Diachasmimorpha longicaudata]